MLDDVSKNVDFEKVDKENEEDDEEEDTENDSDVAETQEDREGDTTGSKDGAAGLQDSFPDETKKEKQMTAEEAADEYQTLSDDNVAFQMLTL